jgi:hypothetical protein
MLSGRILPPFLSILMSFPHPLVTCLSLLHSSQGGLFVSPVIIVAIVLVLLVGCCWFVVGCCLKFTSTQLLVSLQLYQDRACLVAEVVF